MGGEAQAIVKDRPLLPAERPPSTVVRTSWPCDPVRHVDGELDFTHAHRVTL